MSEKTSLALIVPCYNEEESIPLFDAELVKFRVIFEAAFPGSDFSVTVVNNNSTDRSESLLKGLGQKLGFLRVENCASQGYGAALKHGFASVKSEYIAFLDLDNTYPMPQLIDLLHIIRDQKVDIVYGARLHRSSEIGWIRRAGNLFYVILLRYLMNSPLTDVCSGMRIFRQSRKDEIVRLSKNDLSFSIQFTTHVLKNKWKVAEFPIPYRDRVGESKLSVIKDGFAFLAVIIAGAVRKKR